VRRKCPGTGLARLQAFAARARSSDARGCSGVRSGGKAALYHSRAICQWEPKNDESWNTASMLFPSVSSTKAA
jgi:hypothetical protein